MGVITLDTELGSHYIGHWTWESLHWTLNLGVITLDTELGSHYIGHWSLHWTLNLRVITLDTGHYIGHWTWESLHWTLVITLDTELESHYIGHWSLHWTLNLGVITLDTELGSHYIGHWSLHWTLNLRVITLDTGHYIGHWTWESLHWTLVITLDTGHYIGLLLHKLHVIAMRIRFMFLLLVLVPRLFGLSFCYFLVLMTIQLVPIGLMPQSCIAQWLLVSSLHIAWEGSDIWLFHTSGRFVYSVPHIALLHWWMTMNWNSLQSYSLYGKIAPQTSSTVDDVNVSKCRYIILTSNKLR